MSRLFAISRAALALLSVLVLAARAIADSVTFVMNNHLRTPSRSNSTARPATMSARAMTRSTCSTTARPRPCRSNATRASRSATAPGSRATRTPIWGVGPDNPQKCDNCCYTAPAARPSKSTWCLSPLFFPLPVLPGRGWPREGGPGEGQRQCWARVALHLIPLPGPSPRETGRRRRDGSPDEQTRSRRLPPAYSPRRLSPAMAGRCSR